MMRVAGRGDDGLAKALKTDQDGRITISNDRPLITLHENRTGNAYSDVMDVSGIGNVHLQVTGDFEGTVRVEGSMDGINYDLVHTIDKSNGKTAIPITKAGQFISDVRGYQHFRAYVHGYESGTITVLAKPEVIDSFTPYPSSSNTVQVVKNRRIETLYNERISTPADTRFTTDILDVSAFDYYHIYIVGISFDPLGGKYDVEEVPHVGGKPVTSRVNRELGVGLDNIILMKNISSVTPEISLRITPSVDIEATVIVIGGVHNG